MEIHIHHHHHFPETSGEAKLDAILAVLTHQKERLKTMSDQLDALTAEVERNTTVEKSAIVLIQGLKDQLDAAGADPAKLKALSDQLGANDDALAAAVAANTTPPEQA